MGLADVLVPQDQVRAAAQKLAAEIAENAPLAHRRNARHDAARAWRIASRPRPSTSWKSRRVCAQTDDFKEGVKAMAERRVPNFAGR